MNITHPYETPSVDHRMAVLATVKSILLAGVTTIFPDLTCDVFDHAYYFSGFQKLKSTPNAR
jgi:hypothetical protein